MPTPLSQFPPVINLSELSSVNRKVINGKNPGDAIGQTVAALPGQYFVICTSVAAYSNSGSCFSIHASSINNIASPEYLSSLSGKDKEYIGNVGDYLGYSVAIGDLRGNGKSLIIMGANAASFDGKTYAGKLQLIDEEDISQLPAKSYTVSSLNNTYRTTVYGEASNDDTGIFVDAKDLDEDGKQDLIYSASYATRFGRTNNGLVGVLWGSNNFTKNGDYYLAQLNTSSLFRVYGALGGGYCGGYVSAFNDSGIKKLLIGCALTRGGAGDLISIKDVNRTRKDLDLASPDNTVSTIEGLYPNGYFSTNVVSDDFKGSGNQQLAVSAYNASPAPGKASAGQLRIFFGPDITNSSHTCVVNGISSGEQFTRSLRRAGDFNKNGKRDLWVASSSALFFIDGSVIRENCFIDLENPDGVNVVRFNGGTLALGIGDFINNDGIDDALIASSNDSPNGKANAGTFSIIPGDAPPVLQQLKSIPIPHKGVGHLNTSYVNITDLNDSPENFNITVRVKYGVPHLSSTTVNIANVQFDSNNKTTNYFSYTPFASDRLRITPTGIEVPEVEVGITTPHLNSLPPQRLNVTQIRTELPQVTTHKQRYFQGDGRVVSNQNNIDGYSVYPTQASSSLRVNNMQCQNWAYSSLDTNQTKTSWTLGESSTNTIAGKQISSSDTPAVPSCNGELCDDVGLCSTFNVDFEYFGMAKNTISGLVGFSGTPICKPLKKEEIDVHYTIPGSTRANVVHNFASQKARVTSSSNLMQSVPVTQQGIDSETYCIVSTDNEPPNDLTDTIYDPNTDKSIGPIPVKTVGFKYSPEKVGNPSQDATQGQVSRMTAPPCIDPSNATAIEDVGVVLLSGTHHTLYKDANLTKPIPFGPFQGYQGANVVKQHDFMVNGGLYDKADKTGIIPTLRAQCVLPNNLTSAPFDYDYSSYHTVNPPVRGAASGLLQTSPNTPVSLVNSVNFINDDVLVDLAEVGVELCPNNPPQYCVVQKTADADPKPALSNWKVGNMLITTNDPVQLKPLNDAEGFPQEPVILCIQARTPFDAVSEPIFIRANLNQQKTPATVINNQLRNWHRNETKAYTEDNFLATSDVAPSKAIIWNQDCDNFEVYSNYTGSMKKLVPIEFTGRNVSAGQIYGHRLDNNRPYSCRTTATVPGKGGLATGALTSEVGDLIPGYTAARFTMPHQLKLLKGVARQQLVRSTNPTEPCLNEMACIEGTDIANAPFDRPFSELTIKNSPNSIGCHLENSNFPGKILTEIPGSAVGAYLEVVMEDGDKCYLEMQLDNKRGTGNDTLLSEIFKVEGNFVDNPAAIIPGGDAGLELWDYLKIIGGVVGTVVGVIGIVVKIFDICNNRELAKFKRMQEEDWSFAARLRNKMFEKLIDRVKPSRPVGKCCTSDVGKLKKLSSGVGDFVAILMAAGIVCEETPNSKLVEIIDAFVESVLALPVITKQSCCQSTWTFLRCRREIEEYHLGRISSVTKKEKGACTNIFTCNCAKCCACCGPVEYTAEELMAIATESKSGTKIENSYKPRTDAELQMPLELNKTKLTPEERFEKTRLMREIKAIRTKQALERNVIKILGEEGFKKLVEFSQAYHARELTLKNISKDNKTIKRAFKALPGGEDALRVGETSAAEDESEIANEKTGLLSSPGTTIIAVTAANEKPDDFPVVDVKEDAKEKDDEAPVQSPASASSATPLMTSPAGKKAAGINQRKRDIVNASAAGEVQLTQVSINMGAEDSSHDNAQSTPQRTPQRSPQRTPQSKSRRA